jgi:hypothetical protein
VALGLGGHELLAVGFLQGNGLFRFSPAEAFLYAILGGSELQKRKNLHVCPLHTELQQLQGCALANRFVHYFVCAISEDFEPSLEERTVTSHEHRRGCGRTNGQETRCLAVLRSVYGFVQKTEHTDVRQTAQNDSDDLHENDLHRKNLGAPDKQANVAGSGVV